MKYGTYYDTPDRIKYEGSEITLRFEKTSTTSGILTWNIPVGYPGCDPKDLAYDGIVIVADTQPVGLGDKDINTRPKNGNMYVADPTVDPALFCGDRIGATSMVVASFYGDKTTTSATITGLKPEIPYYFAAYAVDNVLQYHIEGVHSYSQQYGEVSTDKGTAGKQTIELGVRPTDPTGLDSTKTYDFKIWIDDKSETSYAPVTVDGANALTYQDLVNTVNNGFKSSTASYISGSAPFAQSFWVNTNTNSLMMWTGSTYIPVPCVFDSIAPNDTSSTVYWFAPTTQTLKVWNTATNTWSDVMVAFTTEHQPNQPTCDDIWVDASNNAYIYDGNVWIPMQMFVGPDPSIPVLGCGSLWVNPDSQTTNCWKDVNRQCKNGDVLQDGEWVSVNCIFAAIDPKTIQDGTLWQHDGILQIRRAGVWANVDVETSQPTNTTHVWNKQGTLSVWDGTGWIAASVVYGPKDPMSVRAGTLWFNTTTSQISVWNALTASWKLINTAIISKTDPSTPALAFTANETLWCKENGSYFKWDGYKWVSVTPILNNVNPETPIIGSVWFHPSTQTYHSWTGSAWSPVRVVHSDIDPLHIPLDTKWFNTASQTLVTWNGVNWSAIIFSFDPVTIQRGFSWYDTSTNALKKWNGTSWVEMDATAFVYINDKGHLIFVSNSKGCTSFVRVVDGTVTTPNLGLFSSLTPRGKILPPEPGTDPVSNQPIYEVLGVGTDGTADERRDMVDSVLTALGYPTIQVELSRKQIEWCIDQGIQTLRRMGSSAYERAFMFMDVKPNQQHYLMTDSCVGFNKIVRVLHIHRATSAFMGNAAGSGVWGQMALQQLYQMGTFDLVSYHIISEYTELMEILFANRIQFTFNERTRMLSLHQNLGRDERVLLDVVVERTEQAILSDRFLNNWIQTWAIAEARTILAEVRGKYQTLPGAGSGVSLNAGDLRTAANEDFERCIQELDDYIANSNVEDFGMGTQFVIG